VVTAGQWSLAISGHCWSAVTAGQWSLLVSGHCWSVPVVLHTALTVYVTDVDDVRK